ncbi:MAG: cation-transporting P-type ATPase, partial [Patescibacteria group bacterium]|nr:cation-transporting P-type ATPase [Patescibacteria group bacterium]
MDTEAPVRPFWTLTPEETAKKLGSDLVRGLSAVDVVTRLRTFGRNEFASARGNTKLRMLARQFKSPLIFILVIAGMATLFIGAWFDATIIFIAIGVSVSLGFFQESRAENAVAYLRSYIQVRTRVFRNGTEREEDSREVVPGDTIHLTLGSRVPADARLVSASNLSVDEAILTGESLPVGKHADMLSLDTPLAERKNMVFGGTLVTEGSATAIVTATGAVTEFGKIAGLVSSTSRERTPIEKTVGRLAWIISIGLSLFVIGIFALGMAQGAAFFDMLLVSLAVAVGAIPEALPVGLTAVLAVGVERLAKRKGIMHSLAAVETLGSTSVIMTDKTGTLTEAKMRLVGVLPTKHLAAGTKLSFSHAALERFSAEQKELLSLSVLGADVLVENPDEDPALWRMIGNPLEANIVRSAALHGIPIPRREVDGAFRLALPFSSEHKFSVSEGVLDGAIVGAWAHRAEEGGHSRVVLGAPDVLLARSSLETGVRDTLLAAIWQAAAEGKRLVGVAVSHGHRISGGSDKLMPKDIRDMRFVGMLAFSDPVRKEARGAIARMERHGVRVVMATGDLPGTAVAVARELGWTVRDFEVCTGEEMRRLAGGDLMRLLDIVKVFARVTPQDKLRIAQLFQKKGEIVAMTGDGVNDAPSLKAVDIGIALGSGSDVAKEVADLVLLDDNFNTIVSAIEEGKRTLRNIRKTFVYLMSNSFDEVMIIGGSLLWGLSLPLSPIQIIWVNLFTGSLPAIAFAFDNDDGRSMRGKLTEKNILNKTVRFLTLGVGMLSSALLFALYWGLSQFTLPEQVMKTFVFACFASYILFVAFSLRVLEKSILSYNPFAN